MKHSPDTFDARFATDPDPWGFATRWYEQRKRDLTLAALPRPRYRSACEPGCANGVLSAALAERCDRLWVSDGSPRAVALARQRLSHVTVCEAWLPQGWPASLGPGAFDLIVLSELGYFLSPPEWAQVLDQAQRSLADDGTLVACHWRRQAADCVWNGDDVHQAMRESLELPHLAGWVDADFRLDVWSGEPGSVAAREGLV